MATWSGNHLWVFTSWRHGGITEAIDDAVRLGYDGLLIKAHDGNPADDTPEFHRQLNTALDRGKAQGLTIGAWGYLYGPRYGSSQIDTEAQAIMDTISMGIDWYVIDAEGEWEVAGGADAVRRLMEPVRNRYPSFPIGFAPFWNTRWHPQYPHQAFAQYCDVVLPQVYYVLANRESAESIQRMWEITEEDFSVLGVPIAPIGQINGATTQQIEAFKSTIGSGTPRSWWLWGPASEDQLNAAATGAGGDLVARVKYEAALARAAALEDKLTRILQILEEPLPDDSGGTIT